MERTRVEEFTCEGKNFVYIDLSDLRINDEFIEAIKVIKPVIANHPENSVYTITNIENVRVDTAAKDLIADYMKENKPYVKFGAVIGLDGVKKLMLNLVFNLSGRNNMLAAYSREQAIDLLLKK